MRTLEPLNLAGRGLCWAVPKQPGQGTLGPQKALSPPVFRVLGFFSSLARHLVGFGPGGCYWCRLVCAGAACLRHLVHGLPHSSNSQGEDPRTSDTHLTLAPLGPLHLVFVPDEGSLVGQYPRSCSNTMPKNSTGLSPIHSGEVFHSFFFATSASETSSVAGHKRPVMVGKETEAELCRGEVKRPTHGHWRRPGQHPRRPVLRSQCQAPAEVFHSF